MASCRSARFSLVAIVVAVHAVVATVGVSSVRGESYNVQDLADNAISGDDACTLREAIAAANNTANTDCGPRSASAPDHIFIVVPGTIVLNAALPAITQGVIITGHSDGSTIDGNRRRRPFTINPSVDVTLEKLTITNALAPTGISGGTVSGNPIAPTNGGDGGAILNSGNLTLVDIRVTHSAAGRGGHGGDTSSGGRGGNGGAIYNAGMLTAYRVTFDANSSGEGGETTYGCCEPFGDGGAIYVANGARATLLATTFTGNATSSLVRTGTGEGAALYADGQVTIIASTFMGNIIAPFELGAIVIGKTGGVEFGSTIIADPMGCRARYATSLGFFDRGYNLGVPGAGCGFSFAFGSYVDWTEPLLEGELRNNGGFVPTIALLSTSRARDGVPVSALGCQNYTDARGVPRPQDVGCDFGAYEVGPNFRRAMYELEIAGAGAGHGTVTSDGIDCAVDEGGSSGQCSVAYVKGTVVDLTALAAADSIFAGWGGDLGCDDGSIVMDADKSCVAIFDLGALSVRGSAYGVGQVPPANSRGRAQVTFDAEFAFAGAIDLASATLTIDALLSEDEEGGAGELVQGIPIVLHAQPGSGSSAATFATPPRATPSITVDVQMEQPSFATVAMTVLRATLPRFPQLCSLASLPPTTNLTTRFTIDDGINPAVTIATQEPWRCRGLIPDPVFPLQPDSLKTP